MDIDLKTVPTEIIKGDTLNFTIETLLPDNSTINFKIVNDIASFGGKDFIVSGGKSEISFTHEETKSFMSGDYILTLKAKYGETVKTIYSAPIYVVEYENGNALNELLVWKKHVNAINGVLGKNASSEFSYYMIAGRQVNKMLPTDLIKLREYFVRQINHAEAEIRRSQGKRRSNVIVTRFGRLY